MKLAIVAVLVLVVALIVYFWRKKKPESFKWVIGDPLSECSVPCGGGLQYVDVTCKSSAGVTADPSMCTGPAPPSQVQCNTQECQWIEGGFGPCDQPCGGGIQTQTVTCQGEKCPGPMPPSSQTCNTQYCQWNTPTWSQCLDPQGDPVTCGGGTSTPTVTCSRPGDQYCDPTKKPQAQACETSPCQWQTGEFGQCMDALNTVVSCGTDAYSYRTVTCPRNGMCATPQPADSQPCNLPYCDWESSQWNPPDCSGVICGTAVQSRTNTCIRDNGITVPGNCNPVPPPTTQTCDSGRTCGWSDGKSYPYPIPTQGYLQSLSGKSAYLLNRTDQYLGLTIDGTLFSQTNTPSMFSFEYLQNAGNQQYLKVLFNGADVLVDSTGQLTTASQYGSPTFLVVMYDPTVMDYVLAQGKGVQTLVTLTEVAAIINSDSTVSVTPESTPALFVPLAGPVLS